MPDQPQDPVTVLAQGAAQVHELYNAYRSAGFDRDHAIYLVGVVISRHPGNPPSGKDEADGRQT